MSKRSYSNFLDKKEFPFSIENNKIIFPKLLSKINNSNNIRFWKIYSYLKNEENGQMVSLNENLISNEKFKTLLSLYPKIKMYIYTDYGQINGKITKTEPTIISEGKNLNRSNETTILTQGIIYMRNLYLKKIKSGYVLKLNEIDNDNIFPMALNVYEKHKKHIIYPCYIQPKLDGVRVITKIENNNIKLMSRRLNEYLGFDFIKEELKPILEQYPNLILDGELYNHDLSLQQISGIVRNENINYEDKTKLQFYIFDCIDINNNYTFEERLNILNTIFYNKNFKYLKLTDTILINNEKESDKFYNFYISQNYEGIVYKNTDARYEYSSYKEIRSMQFLKRKKQYDSEYPIVGFEEGLHGKDKGAIIFIMKTSDNKEFKAVPNMTLKERKNMYKLAKNNFEQLYKGKMATIKFDEYSNENVPLRAKFIAIRDYE